MVAVKVKKVAQRQVTRVRARLGPTLRQAQESLDNREVRNGRRLVNSLSRGMPDVVVMADSSWVFIADGDADRRRLGPMVQEALGPDIRMELFVGAGYHPGIFSAYLHLVSLLPTAERPLFVFPLSVRMHTVAWRYHPLYEYRESIDFMHAISSASAARRMRMRSTAISDEVNRAYRETEIDTWSGRRTIGWYRSVLKDQVGDEFDALERERLVYEFQHGEELDPEGRPLAVAREFGAHWASSAIRSVFYETPIPFERGNQHFGPGFRERAEVNFDLLRRSIEGGAERPLEEVQSGFVMQTHEFLDPADGTEHLNQVGRRHLASMIADGIRRQLH